MANVREREDRCGVLIKYGDREMGYERHDARDLHRELSQIITRWDMERKATDPCGVSNCPAEQMGECRGVGPCSRKNRKEPTVPAERSET